MTKGEARDILIKVGLCASVSSEGSNVCPYICCNECPLDVDDDSHAEACLIAVQELGRAVLEERAGLTHGKDR